MIFQNLLEIFWWIFFENLVFFTIWELGLFETALGQIWPFLFLGAWQPCLEPTDNWVANESTQKSNCINSEQFLQGVVHKWRHTISDYFLHLSPNSLNCMQWLGYKAIRFNCGVTKSVIIHFTKIPCWFEENKSFTQYFCNEGDLSRRSLLVIIYERSLLTPFVVLIKNCIYIFCQMSTYGQREFVRKCNSDHLKDVPQNLQVLNHKCKSIFI